MRACCFANWRRKISYYQSSRADEDFIINLKHLLVDLLPIDEDPVPGLKVPQSEIPVSVCQGKMCPADKAIRQRQVGAATAPNEGRKALHL